MYFDWTYLVLVFPAVLFSLWASHTVDTTFEKYRKTYTARGYTGEQAAKAILRANGLAHIAVVPTSGKLTDHYDPKAQTIRLSPDVFSGQSTAAIGVACHEVGHALQYASNYAPIRLRAAIVPITNIGSRLSIPLIMLGIILSSLGEIFTLIAYLGVIGFALCTLFQLVTLPTELNASRRALAAIHEQGLLTPVEADQARQVLRAAALTYVAALAVSIMQLIRLLVIVDRRRR